MQKLPSAKESGPKDACDQVLQFNDLVPTNANHIAKAESHQLAQSPHTAQGWFKHLRTQHQLDK
jgi:hypothetical protein